MRQASPQTTISDSEMITIEIVGSYLGLSQDQELFEYFGRHYSYFSRTCVAIVRPSSGELPICGW